MLTLVFIISSIIQLGVALYIFKKGRHNLSYMLFFALSLMTFCWAFLSHLSVVWSSSPYLLYVVRLVMFFAVLQVAIFFLFAHVFPKQKITLSVNEGRLYGAFSAVTALLALTPFLFSSITATNGRLNTQIGPAIIVFIVFMIYSIVTSFRTLLIKFQTSSGLKRNQLLLVLIAAIINWGVIPLSNFVLTLWFETLLFVSLSPVFSLVFFIIIAYALARHKLFDETARLQKSTIYVDYYLRNQKHRPQEYYRLQTLVYQAETNHVALDFSGVKHLDTGQVSLLKYLRDYMEQQGKKIYFVGYTQAVFEQLRPLEK